MVHGISFVLVLSFKIIYDPHNIIVKTELWPWNRSLFFVQNNFTSCYYL